MTMRLREAMTDPQAGPIGGKGKVVESDETFVGGKKKNVHKGKPEPKKHAVHALVERGGKMRAKHVADVTAKTLRRDHHQWHDRQVTSIHTDERWPTITWARSSPSTGPSITPRTNTYKDGTGAHSDLPRAFFAILKRGVIGTFHIDQRAAFAALHRRVRLPLEQALGAGHRRFRARRQAAQGRRGKRLTYRPTDKATEPREADARAARRPTELGCERIANVENDDDAPTKCIFAHRNRTVFFD